MGDFFGALLSPILDSLKRDENKPLLWTVFIISSSIVIFCRLRSIYGLSGIWTSFIEYFPLWLVLVAMGPLICIISILFIRAFPKSKKLYWSVSVLFLTGISWIVFGGMQKPAPIDESKYKIAVLAASPVAKNAEEDSVNLSSRIRDQLMNKFVHHSKILVLFLKGKNIEGHSDEEQKKAAIKLCKSLRVHMLIWGEVRVDSGVLDARMVITRNPSFPRKKELHVPRKGMNPLHEMLIMPESPEPEHLVFKKLFAHQVADFAALVCGMVYYENGKWDRAIEILRRVSHPVGRYYEARSLLEQVWHSEDPKADVSLAIDIFEDLSSFCVKGQIDPKEEPCWASKAGLASALTRMADLVTPERAFTLLEEAAKLDREVSGTLLGLGLLEERAYVQRNLGIVLAALGERISGDKGKAYLVESIKVSSSSADFFAKQGILSQWANSKFVEGVALRLLSEREAPEQRFALLKDSEEAHRQASRAFSSAGMQFEWAITQVNLGGTLAELARGQDKRIAMESLISAVSAFEQAAIVFNKNTFPVQWAGIRNNAGFVLCQLGELKSGKESEEYLRDSIESFNDSLKVYGKDSFPQQWAMVQNNLGISWYKLSGILSESQGTDYLEKAREAWSNALTIWAAENDTVNWARAQNNLGNALRNIGMMKQAKESIPILEEAVRAYKSALTVRKKEAFPTEWAMTQRNLGVALTEIARRDGSQDHEEYLSTAEDCFRRALTVYGKDFFPSDWASTTCDLAYVLTISLSRNQDADSTLSEQRLEEALRLYREASSVYSKERNPIKWAYTKLRLGLLLNMKSLHYTDPSAIKKIARESEECLSSALKVISASNNLAEYYQIMDALGMTLMHLAKLTAGSERLYYQEKAKKCFNESRRFYVKTGKLEEINRLDNFLKVFNEEPPCSSNRSK